MSAFHNVNTSSAGVARLAARPNLWTHKVTLSTYTCDEIIQKPPDVKTSKVVMIN